MILSSDYYLRKNVRNRCAFLKCSFIQSSLTLNVHVSRSIFYSLCYEAAPEQISCNLPKRQKQYSGNLVATRLCSVMLPK